jgi:hypothetical protein
MPWPEKQFKQVKRCPDTEPPECRLDVVQEGWGVLGVVARFHASAGRRAIQMCLFRKAGGVSYKVDKKIRFEDFDVIEAEF